jgi:hypothetical protein
MSTTHLIRHSGSLPWWSKFRALFQRWLRGRRQRTPAHPRRVSRCVLSVQQCESREAPTDVLGMATGAAGLALLGIPRDPSPAALRERSPGVGKSGLLRRAVTAPRVGIQ